MSEVENSTESEEIEETPEIDEIIDTLAEDSVEEVESVEPEVLSVDEQVNKWKDVAARSQADLDNFRKRMAREKSEAIQYANRSLLEQLLPIIDNFEMGLKAATASEGDSSVILTGMSMVFKQINDFLTEQGVEVIESDGKAFDPNVHEALKQEPSADIPEGQVIYTMRRGFRMKDRVLRAANVVVSSGPAEEG
ncbi:nucleotide exchange factor GrpE [Verrucomicrobiales bacterium BCK34]|nr:nucleotide exchange factor GrpE [Verrucomicrobiales bacterium BCK34]